MAILDSNCDCLDTGLLLEELKNRISKDQGIAEFDNGNSGTAKTIDFGESQHHVITLTDDCTFSFSNEQPGIVYRIRIVNTGTYSVTWPVEVVWSGGSALTGNAEDIVELYYNGTNYYSRILNDFG